jgi:dTDP-4-dehydrorhamnose 3,5-epimerase-like enzyme
LSGPHTILRPTFERKDARGTFLELLNDGHWESLICGRMEPGAVLGQHYHRRTAVFFFLLEGDATVTSVHVDSGARVQDHLPSMHGVLFPVNVAHAIRFSRSSSFVMMKSMRYDPQDTDTITFEVVEADASS